MRFDSLTVADNGEGTATYSPVKPAGYGLGERVLLEATPDVGWRFVYWRNVDTGEIISCQEDYTYAIRGNTNIEAVFEALHSLEVTVEGMGRVDRSDSRITYPEDTPVTLTAVPNPGWVFSGWTDDATGATNPLVLTVDGPKAITAKFSPVFNLQIKTFISVNSFWTPLSCISDYGAPPETPPVFAKIRGGGDDRTFSRTSQAYRTIETISLVPDTTNATEDFDEGYIEGSHNPVVGVSHTYQQNALGTDFRITQEALDDTEVGDCDLKHCEEAGIAENSPPVSVNDISSTVKEYTFVMAAAPGCTGIYGLLSPSIDYNLTVQMDASNPDFTRWRLSGAHDKYPWYEVYLDAAEAGPSQTLHLFQPRLNAPAGLLGLFAYLSITPADGIIERQ